MAVWVSQPGATDDPRSDVHDRTLWMVLRALVANRPAVIGVIDPDQPHVARGQIRSAVRGFTQFADKVGEIADLPDAPAGSGSARSVATSVVRLCRAFAQGWTHDAPVTSTRVAQFKREFALLEATLDAIAIRRPRSPV